MAVHMMFLLANRTIRRPGISQGPWSLEVLFVSVPYTRTSHWMWNIISKFTVIRESMIIEG